MTDGCSDEARSQDRYFDALRARLIAEDLLYGEYDPGTCPNIQTAEDPVCVAGGRLECGPAWCQPCQAHFGPWGAWRAVVGELTDYIDEIESDYPIYPHRWDCVGPRDVARIIMRPVGWAP